MPSNRRRLNKPVSGYHMLMLLSAVDYSFHIEEEKIIREYIFQEFPFKVNLDNEIDLIASLDHSEWHQHFLQCMDDFYADSTEEERNSLLKFALYLAKADGIITSEENFYLKSLFEAWDHSHE